MRLLSLVAVTELAEPIRFFPHSDEVVSGRQGTSSKHGGGPAGNSG